MSSRLSNGMARRQLQDAVDNGRPANGTFALDPMTGRPIAMAPPPPGPHQVDVTQIVRRLAEAGEPVQWRVMPDVAQHMLWLTLKIGPIEVPCGLDATGIASMVGALEAAAELLAPAPPVPAELEQLLQSSIAIVNGPGPGPEDAL